MKACLKGVSKRRYNGWGGGGGKRCTVDNQEYFAFFFSFV